MEFKCNCHNSGTNSFTGKCDRCGMTKPSQGVYTSSDSGNYSAKEFEYKEEDYWIKQINNLQRYDIHVYDYIIEDKDGEYIKLEDVLKLFSAQKEIKNS